MSNIISLKTFLNDPDEIFHKGIICGAVIRMSILVERRLKQNTQVPNPESHLRNCNWDPTNEHDEWILDSVKVLLQEELLASVGFVWL